MGLPSGTITLLFTDIEGSTRMLAALGEEYGTLLAEHHSLLREVSGAAAERAATLGLGGGIEWAEGLA